MPPRPNPATNDPDVVEIAAIFAAVAVGAAAMEVALIPGILIGGAAYLAPRVFTKARGRRIRAEAVPRPGGLPASRSHVDQKKRPFDWRDLPFTQSAAKTVTFRIISSGLDFSWNYLLLGEVAAAVSLSGFSLIAAPAFYFLHETVWNRFWPRDAVGRKKPATFQISQDTKRFIVSKTMAKTLTFRTFATISEFSVNYLFVRDLVLATKLSAFSIVAGPFVYLAHEKVWERHGANRATGHDRRARPLRAQSPRLMSSEP